MKNEKSSTDAWLDGIAEVGRQHKIKREEESQARAAWFRDYFQGERVQDLGPNRLLRWTEGGVVVNSKFREEILSNRWAVETLWNEIVHRTDFEETLRSRMELGAMRMKDEAEKR